MPKFNTTSRIVSDGESSYTAEAELVQQRAERFEPSVIRRGQIVFFSTASGDAWMLDAKDGEVACLAREGQRDPIPIEESADKFGVAWQGCYRFEEDLFIVSNDTGSESAMLGYPVAEIKRLIDGWPAGDQPPSFDAIASRERLRRTGRNEPCPCGSGRKYKKCCLPRDEELARGAAAGRRSESDSRATAPGEQGAGGTAASRSPGGEGDGPAVAAGTQRGIGGGITLPDGAAAASATVDEATVDEATILRDAKSASNALWDELERVADPGTEQMNAFLDRFLALAPDATDWSELFDAFAERNHTDLPGVFRRMCAAVPATKATSPAFLYWSAAGEFVRRGRTDLVPEIVARYATLDRETYNSDALVHVEEWVLLAGYDGEALALAERFLPVERSDPELMPHAVTESCQTIFKLRAGVRLRESGTNTLEPAAVARELRREIEDEIYADYAQRAARVICRVAPPWEFTRADFELTFAEVREGEPGWEAALRRFAALMHVAREAWEVERCPPGRTLFALRGLLEVAYEMGEVEPGRRGEHPTNLLDCLHPAGMEHRTAHGSRALGGINLGKAGLLLEAHAQLRRFAVRHGLIDDVLAATSEANVARLRQKLGFAT